MSGNQYHELGWGSFFGPNTPGNAHGGKGGGTGRGRRSGRGGMSHSARPQNPPDTSLHPLGELLATFDNETLNQAASSTPGTPSITDCQYVASYNWLNDRKPTILVPGKPPLWTPLDVPRPMKEDSGDYFRDPNAARFPIYPTEPAVRALLSNNPEFPTPSVDIFACGSTFGNLLRFVRSDDKFFRFSAEIVNNTMFLIRKENSPDELIDGVRGYGHTFPENYTTWDEETKGSETHQRVVQYSFGGYNCLVRYECDGYLKTPSVGHTDKRNGRTHKSGDEDLGKMFSTVAVGRVLPTKSGLTVKNVGSEVPQDSVFDLKTRSGRYGKTINMEDQLPSLWVKQIPNFIVAYHNGKGLFANHRIDVRDVREDVQRWEADNIDALRRLVALLHKIVEIVKESKNHRINIYRPSLNRLEIREQVKGGSHVLPTSLRQCWATGGNPSFSMGNKQHNGEDEDDDKKGHLARNETQSETSKGDRAKDVKSLSPKDVATKYFSVYEEELDYTACSAEHCGYCGRCKYV